MVTATRFVFNRAEEQVALEVGGRCDSGAKKK